MRYKIGVVGSINRDMTLLSPRIPRPGETLLGDSVAYAPGGKGANQAFAAARFGACTAMFGCVGDDESGKMMVENLKSVGVDTGHIAEVKGESTGLAVITVGENDNTIIVIPGANYCVDRNYIDCIWSALSEMDMVLIQQEIPADTVDYLVALCHEAGIKTMLNPAPARAVSQETLEKADYLTPNEHELEWMYPGEEMETLLEKYPEKLIVTLGKRGAAAAEKTGHILSVPAGKVSVQDTTGAGDTFNAILACALADGMELKQALLYANTGAGISTEKMGAQSGMPSREQVEERLNGGRKL